MSPLTLNDTNKGPESATKSCRGMVQNFSLFSASGLVHKVFNSDSNTKVMWRDSCMTVGTAHASQDLTFLHLARSSSRSIRPIWWTPPPPHHIMCSVHCPWLLVPTHYSFGLSQLHDRMHVWCGAPKTPYKSGCLGQVSQSVSSSWVVNTA